MGSSDSSGRAPVCANCGSDDNGSGVDQERSTARTEARRDATATETIIAGMTAMLAPTAPLPFRVISARWQGARSRRRAVASVELFDGLPGEVVVWRHSFGAFTGWAHEWISLPGGAISCENGAWVRETEVAAGSVVLAVDPSRSTPDETTDAT